MLDAQSLREAALAAIKHLPPVNGQPQRPDMIIIILPPEAGPIRQTVKYYGDVEYGIATQCVVSTYSMRNIFIPTSFLHSVVANMTLYKILAGLQTRIGDLWTSTVTMWL
jgi:hypothetical protein